MPERIQLQRTKGWRKPAGAIVVARPSNWGNPFTIANARDAGYMGTDDELRALCVEAFRSWLTDGLASSYWFGNGTQQHVWMSDHLHELRGRDLACWCPTGEPCHADVLLTLANQEVTACADAPSTS